MWTLDTFYRSKEWLLFRLSVINDRLNENGDMICEYCGEVITHQYDCIAHHCDTYLTEQNVNDVSISLNPENIQLVHHKCHNRIHDKLSYREDVRHIYLVYGSPLSGKTTWVDSVKSYGDLIIDMDSIWQCISGCDRYVKPNVLKNNAFDVRDKLIEQVKYRKGYWHNAYIIGGYPLISERERLCKLVGAEEIFIDTSKDECVKRLMNAADGRNKEEWLHYIDDWWKRYAPRSY